MENTTILPVLDTAVLQEKANEYAMKGAIESLKEFYSGYNSPYRQAIDEDLKNKGMGFHLQLPDILAKINQSLSNEIDKIANEAIAKSFIPLVSKFLTRAEKQITFSQFLKEFIRETDSKTIDDCHLKIEEDHRHGWLRVNIGCKNRDYSLTLHEDYESKKTGLKKYSILSLPYDGDKHTPKMKLTIEAGSLEMPFVKDVLQDSFITMAARMIMASTLITMDIWEFDEDMFPVDECHCH